MLFCLLFLFSTEHRYIELFLNSDPMGTSGTFGMGFGEGNFGGAGNFGGGNDMNDDMGPGAYNQNPTNSIYGGGYNNQGGYGNQGNFGNSGGPGFGNGNISQGLLNMLTNYLQGYQNNSNN